MSKMFEKFGDNFGTIDSGAKGISIITGIGTAVGALVGIAGAMCNAANRRRREEVMNLGAEAPESIGEEVATESEELVEESETNEDEATDKE